VHNAFGSYKGRKYLDDFLCEPVIFIEIISGWLLQKLSQFKIL
jgi:hypothetical protein